MQERGSRPSEFSPQTDVIRQRHAHLSTYYITNTSIINQHCCNIHHQWQNHDRRHHHCNHRHYHHHHGAIIITIVIVTINTIITSVVDNLIISASDSGIQRNVF